MPILISHRRAGDFGYFYAESEQFAHSGSRAATLFAPRLVCGGDLQQTEFGPETPGLLEAQLGSHAPNTSDLRTYKFLEVVIPAPKWVSVLAGILGPETRGDVVEAHKQAVSATVEVLARDYSWISSKNKNLVRFEAAHGLGGVEFVHMISRSRDPHLHSHLLFSNSAFGTSNKRHALDFTTLRYGADHLERVYLVHLGQSLSSSTNWRRLDLLRPDLKAVTSGFADNEAMAKHLASTRVFSQRSAAILADMASRGTHSSKSAKVAALRTRGAKRLDDSPQELIDGWMERATREMRGSHLEITQSKKVEPLLSQEVSAVTQRIVGHANMNGADRASLRLDESMSNRHLGSSFTTRGESDYVLDQNVRSFLDNNGQDPILGPGSDGGFISPPSRQRVYRRSELLALLHAREKSGVADGTLFQMGFPIGARTEIRFALEFELRNAAAGKRELVRLGSDYGLQSSGVGKTISSALRPLETNHGVPAHAVVVVSATVDPGDLAGILDSAPDSVAIHVVDQKRHSAIEKLPIGRGSGFRSWLQENCASVVADDRNESHHVDTPADVALQIKGDSFCLVAHQSTLSMLRSLSQKVSEPIPTICDDRSPRVGSAVVVSDSKLADVVFRIAGSLAGKYPVDSNEFVALGRTDAIDGSLDHSQSVCPPNALSGDRQMHLKQPNARLRSGIFSVSEYVFLSRDLAEKPQSLDRLHDPLSLVEALSIDHNGVSQDHLVRPFGTMIEPENQALVRTTLATLGFTQTPKLLSGASEQIIGVALSRGADSSIDVEQLQRLNLLAMQRPDFTSVKGRDCEQHLSRSKYGSQLCDLNHLLLETLASGSDVGALDIQGSVAAHRINSRLEGLLTILEDQSKSQLEVSFPSSKGAGQTRWLVGVCKSRLESRESELAKDAGVGSQLPAALLARAESHGAEYKFSLRSHGRTAEMLKGRGLGW